MTIDTELDRHSPLNSVVKCMLAAVQNLSSNEYIYADDEASTNIHCEEVEVIINLLSHRAESAIDIADGILLHKYIDSLEKETGEAMPHQRAFIDEWLSSQEVM